MQSPSQYWSLTYGTAPTIWTEEVSNGQSSRAQSIGRLNSTSSGYSSSSNSVNTTHFIDSYCSGSDPPFSPQRLSEEQFDIIDDLHYEDVDDMGLIDCELLHQNREALIRNLYNAEQAYLDSLNQLVTLFMQPLRKDAQQPSSNFIGMKKIICTEQEIQRLFGNIEDILEVQREIVATLDLRLRMWGPTQIISDVFQGWFKKLVEVYTPYFNNYDNSATTYERLRSYQPFRKFTDTLHKEPALRGATLSSLLQLPVKAINRHAQLITELAEATAPLHPDYVGLKMCRRRVHHLVKEIQPKVEDCDNIDQVLSIHRSLSNAPFTIKKGRRLILQAEVSRTFVHSRMVGERRLYILFSDFLAFVRPRQHSEVLQYKGHLNLERARVKPMAPEEVNGRENCIGITPLYQGVDIIDTTLMTYPTIHVIQLSSPTEQQEWLDKVSMVINKLNTKADQRRAATSNSSRYTCSVLTPYYFTDANITL
ncbi:Dbl homology domain-containing protein [Fennellomyces sp. T-0311]|nr:Dbl homology domain-containing protein [Fennellomyces sp. T-0311]